jgi:RNA polymerase sigma factor (sigma-70 family)
VSRIETQQNHGGFTEVVDPVAEVLARIRGGDRHAAAAFVMENQDFIRRRYRQRLGLRLRRLIDSQDLVSTIARRLDACVLGKGVVAKDEAQLWALIFRIGDNALIDRRRVLARLEQVEGPDSEIAREWRCRMARAERARPDGALMEVDRMLRLLASEVDRQILSLWLAGLEHNQIAEELGLSPTNVRQHWARICARLRADYAPEWSV